MNDVTILGLGVMGSALARQLLERGHRVTVWNRTAAKAEPLLAAGAFSAASPADAVRSSQLAIVCVSDYASTFAALEAADLRGHTLVQLSTGSPADARAGERWAKQRGADYLDGAIMATPRQMGTPASSILLSGSPSAFAAAREAVADTAGSVTYLGENVAAASALDLAFLSCLFQSLLGFYHGLRLVESEQLGLDAFAAMFDAAGPAMIQMLRHDAESVIERDYANPEATLEVCFSALKLIERQALEAGIDSAMPRFAAEQFERGMSAGLAQQSPAALVEVLRAVRRAPSL